MDDITGDMARLAERFEADRAHLAAVAYRLLGSAAEADDALQDAWLRAQQAETEGIENLTGWLTTIVTRVCLNHLRARRSRREEFVDAYEPQAAAATAPAPAADAGDPAREALLADEVGVALLVVLDTLGPAERVAFVLHDMFAVPFDEIASVIERTPDATRQLASRARRRVRGRTPAPGADTRRRRAAVEAYLAAARGGDFAALFALLDPDVVLRADAFAAPTGEPVTVRGAESVARGATRAAIRAGHTGLALLDGDFGLVMAPHGRPRLALSFTFSADGTRITGIDIVAEPERLRKMGIEVAGTGD